MSSESPQEWESLFERSASGDTQAENLLWADIRQTLHRVGSALMTGNRHWSKDTSDIVQDLCLDLRPHLPKLTTRKSMVVYAARAVRNRIIDHARRRRVRHADAKVPLIDVSVGDTTLRVDPDQLARLFEKLDQLDEEHSTVFTLFHYSDSFTLQRVAEELGISVDMVRARLKFTESWLIAEMTAE